MFWWNAFLFGVLLWFIVGLVVHEDFACGWWATSIIASFAYTIVFTGFGMSFICYNSLEGMLKGQTSGESMMKAFTYNQMMINSLTPELQEYFGVEEHFSVLAIVINVLIIVAIIYVIYLICSDCENIYPYQDSYKNFNDRDYRETVIPYEFKVFKSTFNSLILSEQNPFVSVNETALRYKDWETNKVYRIHFSYFDYIKYRHFLRQRDADKNYIKMKNQSADTIKAVLDFNEIVKRDVKKEAQRDWGDLIRSKK